MGKYKQGTNAFIGGTREDFESVCVLPEQVQECYEYGIPLQDVLFAPPDKWHKSVRFMIYAEKTAVITVFVLKIAAMILLFPVAMIFAAMGINIFRNFFKKW